MGCFGYICPVCDTSIRGDCHNGGEHCILIHKRHGEEIGRAIGHYNEYGSVVENEHYRGDEEKYPNGKVNKNTHTEICRSEMSMKDSNAFGTIHLLPDGSQYDESWAFFEDANYLFSLDSRFESFREGLTPAMSQKIADLRKGKGCLFKWMRDKDSLNEEEQSSLKNYFKQEHKVEEELRIYMKKWLREQPLVIAQSGTICVHKKCYDSLTAKQRKNLPISKNDPDQSWGDVRPEYC